MAAPKRHNGPFLPPLKESAVGEYRYLYKAQVKYRNGRTYLIKQGESVGKILKNNAERQVVWKDSFLDEYPELRAFDTYMKAEEVAPAYDMSDRQFEFRAKRLNSGNFKDAERMLCEAGATYVFDKLLEDTLLIRMLNRLRGPWGNAEKLISLAYYHALSPDRELKGYTAFAVRTRLPDNEALSEEQIKKICRSTGKTAADELRDGMIEQSKGRYGSGDILWLIETEYPNNIIKRLCEGGELYRKESDRELKAFIKGELKKHNSRQGSSFSYETEQEHNRALTLFCRNTGEPLSFAFFRSGENEIRDLSLFLKNNPLLLKSETTAPTDESSGLTKKKRKI